MVKKAYFKSTARLFLKHILRLLSISAIFVVTVSLISGLGDVQSDIKQSITASYQEDNIHDFVIRGEKNEVDKVNAKIKERKDEIGIKDVDDFVTFDFPDTTINTKKFSKRVIWRSFENSSIDKLTLIGDDSRWPREANEIVVERSTNDIVNHQVGDEIEILIPHITIPFKVKVVGIVKNPTMVAETKEPSDYFEDNEYQYINDVFYVDKDKAKEDYDILSEIMPALNVTINERSIFSSYNEPYKDKINVVKALLSDGNDASVLTLYDNYSLQSLNMYADKVGVLATIIIVFCILIAVLVIYSTLSRLLDEDRSSMAVLKTLGYSDFAIAARYILFVLVAGIIGAAISVGPARLVNSIIIDAFGIQYSIKAIPLPVVGPYFFFLSGVIILASLILTFIKSVRMADYRPVELLTPKAPKVGKKILLERTNHFWKRLSFRYKSTCRNVFRYKARLFMTVLSIMAATTLVFASFSLLTNTFVMTGFESLKIITIVLITFSAALCALVIYNITNINISERTREIATLMVLGYRNNEVTGYVYREIYILTAIGAIIGLPAGVGFTQFVFVYIGTFELSNVSWWVYLVSPIMTFFFAFFATHLLHYKIIKIDMNESLKVLE